ASAEQALLHVWDRWCRDKACGQCPLGASSRVSGPTFRVGAEGRKSKAKRGRPSPDARSLAPDARSLAPDPRTLAPDPRPLAPDPRPLAPDPRPGLR
ncbi:MAG: hypothetical protein ACYDAG_10030, partial [Chloroflexota bacterium]